MAKVLRAASVVGRRADLVPYVVLGISLAATVALCALVGRFAGARDGARFANALESTRDRIQGRLDTYVGLLVATRGLFAADDDVTAADFRRFVAQLELDRRYLGIQGIGFSRRIPAESRAAVEAEMRGEALDDFRVWPDHPRAEYHAILFLEPLDRRNRAAIGYDMFSDPVRREAMARARDLGVPAASGRVTLVQEIDEEKQAGFLIYLPVYAEDRTPATPKERRDALVGFVYSPFRVDDLLDGVFGSELQPRVAFSIHDGTPATDNLLHVSAGFEGTDDARLSAVETVDVAGRPWTLTFRSRPAFERLSNRWLVPWTAALGTLASLAGFAVLKRRARALEELRLSSLVLDGMREGVSVAAENGTILYTNPAEDAMFGYGPREPAARAPGASRRLVADAEVIERLRRDGAWTGEFTNVRQDGTPFITHARITSVDVRGKAHWVCMQEDVTERKRAEREREELLAREQAARAEAEAANRAKDEFLAMLGHELRNPLAPIVTALDLLGDAQPDVRRRARDVIRRQVGYVVRLVDDLLDVSRITRGKVALERRPVDMSAAVAQALEMVEPLMEEHGQRLRVSAPPGLLVEGDLQRLSQVIANLLTNAAKYSHPGGEVDVRLEREGDEIVLRVRDQGIGIPADLLPRIFDLFAQGPQELDRSRGGLGIGLTLVRNLVELHGGHVEARSEGRDRGSELIVRLPASRAVAPLLEGAPEPVVRSATPRRVLVVDDNREAADLVVELLRGAGHEARAAYDGPQALAAAAELRPEVAILDLGLPTMDGFELARRLDGTRLIALTGYGQESHRARARDAGILVHLIKPVAPGVLLEAIERVSADLGARAPR